MYINRREFLKLAGAALGLGILGAAGGSISRKPNEAGLVSNEDSDQVTPLKLENVIYPEGVNKVEINGEVVVVLNLQSILVNDLKIVFDRKSNSFNLGNSKAGDEFIKGVVTNFGPIRLSYQTLKLDGSVDRNSPTDWKVVDKENRLIARRPIFYLPQ